MSRLSKDMKKVVRAARAAGWRVEERATGHVMLFPADRTLSPVTCSSGAGDPRTMRNIIAQLRARGLDL